MATLQPATDSPPGGPAGGARRMLGFYIGLAVALLLFVAGYFAWTPLKVWYWEREARVNPPGPALGKSAISFAPTRQDHGVYELLKTGPGALPAFERLLTDHDLGLRVRVMMIASGARDLDRTWLLPLIVANAKHEDLSFARLAIQAAQAITGETFIGDWDKPDTLEEVTAKDRKKLLAWWEREGKAKYGRGEE